MEKHRNNFVVGILNISGHTDSEGNINASQQAEVLNMEETISYTNSGLGVGYNDCIHNKYEYSLPLSTVHQTSNENNDLNIGTPGWYIRNARALGRPYATQLTDLCIGFVGAPSLNHLAFRAMIKRIRMPRYLSILNFLYELKDFIGMFEFWSLRRSKLDNIANGTLNEEFGWRPFLQDVCDLLKALREFRSKFNKWLSQQHIPHVTHYKKILTEDDLVPRLMNFGYDGFLVSSPLAPEPQGTPLGTSTVGLSYNLSGTLSHLRAPEWICTMKYTYWCPDALKANKELGAFLDAFNVYWDPQVLWNAIPFSFIVDWFFNVGDWLHQNFAKPNLDLKLRVIDFCISVKCDVLMEGAVRFPYSVPAYDSNDANTYSYHSYQDRARVYNRVPCIPYTEDPLRVLPPMDELRKLVLALALGHNCARPRKRHGKKQKGRKGEAG